MNKSPPSCCCKNTPTNQETRYHAVRARVGVFFIVLTVLTSFLGLPPLLIILISALNSMVTIFLGWDSYTQVFRTLGQKLFPQSARSSDASSTTQNKGSLTVDALFVLSASTALLASTLNLIFPQFGIGAMYNAALIIFTSRHLGQYFIKTVRKEINDIPQLQSLAAEQVSIDTLPVAATALKVNDLFSFQGKSGADVEYILPVNCKLFSDTNITVNYKYITDNNQEIVVGKDVSMLPAGTVVNISENPVFHVTDTLQESHLATSEVLLDNPPSVTPIMHWLQHVTHYLLPILVGIAMVTGIVIGYIYFPVLGLITAINILTSVCPCILGLIPGLMAKIGVYKGQKIGVQFASGAAVEKFAQVDVIVFDLNGTLTDGRIEVKVEGSLDDDIRSLLGALKARNIHPVVQAISSTIALNNSDQNITIDKIAQHSGGIVFTVIDTSAKTERRYLMGNDTFLRPLDPENRLRGNNATPDLTYLVCQNSDDSSSLSVQARFSCQTTLRPQAKAVVQQLKAAKKAIYICTGASETSASKHAQELGIDDEHVLCNQSAQDKFNFIQQLRAGGKTKVAVIGNGLNDVQALRNSDFGMYVALEQNDKLHHFLQPRADATISEECFSVISTALHLCQDLVSKTKWLIILNLSYNAIMVAIGIVLPLLGIAMIPALGALAMVVQAAWVSCYCYYIYRSQAQPLTPSPEYRVV